MRTSGRLCWGGTTPRTRWSVSAASARAVPLREHFDLRLVGVKPLGRNLPPGWGVRDAPLLEVLPWSNRVVETVLQRPDGPGGRLEIHAGRLWVRCRTAPWRR
jgi:hypothetical protein